MIADFTDRVLNTSPDDDPYHSMGNRVNWVFELVVEGGRVLGLRFNGDFYQGQ